MAACNCACENGSHEMWCASQPEGMTIGELYSFTGDAMVQCNVHESKAACVRHEDGSYQLLGSATVEFIRGAFMLVVRPTGARTP